MTGIKLELNGVSSMEVANITGIREPIVGRKTNLKGESIAREISWAFIRATTRTEDVAYCLTGLFEVNMPLLYGEGKKVFIRLQEEIMKNSDDHFLFAWTRGVARTQGAATACSHHHLRAFVTPV